MFGNVFVPMCAGPCAYGGGGRATAVILHYQQNAFSLIRREISERRLASLTPAKMRAELADLGARIERARTALK